MRLEGENLKDQLETTIKKLNFLEKALIISANAKERFELQYQIEECKTYIARLKSELHGLPTTGFFNKRLPHGRYGEISCDRHREIEYMKGHFDKYQDLPFQHYFISGQIEDKADSLVERFVKQVLENQFDVDCPREIESSGSILKVEALPLSTDLERSKQALRRYFSSRFYYGPERELIVPTTMDDLFQSNLPILQRDYLVTVFKISRHHHETFLPVFLQWVIQDFCQSRHPQLKLIFFYIFIEENDKTTLLSRVLGWRKKERTLEKTLHTLLHTHPSCCHLPPLSWVPTDDLKAWFDSYSSKTLDAEYYIEQAKQQHARHYHPEKDAFRMHVVEYLLREIIEWEIRSHPAI